MPTSPDKKTKSVDPDGEAEAIGEIVIDVIIMGSLVTVDTESSDGGIVFKWAANAAEQIGTAIMDLMDKRKAPLS